MNCCYCAAAASSSIVARPSSAHPNVVFNFIFAHYSASRTYVYGNEMNAWMRRSAVKHTFAQIYTYTYHKYKLKKINNTFKMFGQRRVLCTAQRCRYSSERELWSQEPRDIYATTSPTTSSAVSARRFAVRFCYMLNGSTTHMLISYLSHSLTNIYIYTAIFEIVSSVRVWLVAFIP